MQKFSSTAENMENCSYRFRYAVPHKINPLAPDFLRAGVESNHPVLSYEKNVVENLFQVCNPHHG